MLSNINKIGFIGCGKMGSAIISGVLKAGFTAVTGVEVSEEMADTASKRLGITVTTDVKTTAKNSDIIILALKPQYILECVSNIKDEINNTNKILVSVAAGVTTEQIEKTAGGTISVIRVMPNTPALIGEGVFGVAKGRYATDENVCIIKSLLKNIGFCIDIDETQIDIVTALSGSGPAFFYKIINEMALGAKKLGLEYDKALQFALKTAIGSAKMIEQADIPVETLISNVATKGGCTAVGVDYMNEIHSDKIFAELIKRTTGKAESLGKAK